MFLLKIKTDFTTHSDILTIYYILVKYPKVNQTKQQLSHWANKLKDAEPIRATWADKLMSYGEFRLLNLVESALIHAPRWFFFRKRKPPDDRLVRNLRILAAICLRKKNRLDRTSWQKLKAIHWGFQILRLPRRAASLSAYGGRTGRGAEKEKKTSHGLFALGTQRTLISTHTHRCTHTHTHTHKHTQRERERERVIHKHTHTHTHTLKPTAKHISGWIFPNLFPLLTLLQVFLFHCWHSLSLGYFLVYRSIWRLEGEPFRLGDKTHKVHKNNRHSFSFLYSQKNK